MARVIDRELVYPDTVLDVRLPDDLPDGPADGLGASLYALQCEILESVTRGVDIADVGDLLCRRLEALAPGIVCSILLIEEGRLHPLAAPSLPKEFVTAISGLPIGPDIGSCGASAFLGAAVDAPDIETDPRWTPYNAIPLAAGLRACWSGPITSRDGRVIGTFALYFRTSRSPDRRELQIVESCLHLCALIIERQNALSALTRTNRFLDATLDTMSQGLCLFDAEETLKVVNRRFSAIYDLPPDSLRPGMTLADVSDRISPACSDDFTSARLEEMWRTIFEGGEPQQFVDQLRNGRFLSVSALPVGDGSWLATVEDVTDRHHAEARINYMAHHDALTGLPNRGAFHETLDAACNDRPCALLTLDLDRFKAVNDGFGHPVGDMLLSMVAERLRDCVGDAGIVTRLGGDEFAVLLTKAAGKARAADMAARIIRQVSQPFPIDGRSIDAGVSIGIALAPETAATSEQLLRHSDIALYRAKRDQPGTYRFYDAEMSRLIEERRTLEADLRQALRRSELEIVYQPVLSLRARAVAGFEALLRWNHPQRGLVSPSVFIPIAEETGMIMEIGAWVLNGACAAATTWPDGIKVAVNLSATQFGGDVVGAVRDALARSGLAAERLDLEITESILLNSSADVLSSLHGLRDMGVQVSMDDFGTGYSSLSYLNRFPLTRIKVDRSFVSSLPAGREALAVVRAVMGLGKTLNMVTTAEGVETWAQLDILRSEGCDEVQGYFFSRPLPAMMVPEMLATASRRLTVH